VGNPLTQALLVGAGGFAGANARDFLGAWIGSRLGFAFPAGTLVINVTGSLAIGILLVLLVERLGLDPAWRLLLVTGFLGGYTTFSAYTFEAIALLESGNPGGAAWYILGSNVLGLAACFAGILLARTVLAGR
jgi:CrcB protein